jgi:hypothetical protein
MYNSLERSNPSAWFRTRGSVLASDHFYLLKDLRTMLGMVDPITFGLPMAERKTFRAH